MEGELAEGLVGMGRMTEPEEIAARVEALLGLSGPEVSSASPLAPARARHRRWDARAARPGALRRKPLLRPDGRRARGGRSGSRRAGDRPRGEPPGGGAHGRRGGADPDRRRPAIRRVEQRRRAPASRGCSGSLDTQVHPAGSSSTTSRTLPARPTCRLRNRPQRAHAIPTSPAASPRPSASSGRRAPRAARSRTGIPPPARSTTSASPSSGSPRPPRPRAPTTRRSFSPAVPRTTSTVSTTSTTRSRASSPTATPAQIRVYAPWLLDRGADRGRRRRGRRAGQRARDAGRASSFPELADPRRPADLDREPPRRRPPTACSPQPRASFRAEPRRPSAADRLTEDDKQAAFG